MGEKRSREAKVLRGLAQIVGLPPETDEWQTLKLVAETLGLHVAADGTTAEGDDEEGAAAEAAVAEEAEAEPSHKRARVAEGEGAGAPAAAALARPADSGDRDPAARCAVDEDDEDEDGDEVAGSGGGGGGDADEEGGDVGGGGMGEEEDALMEVDPVEVEDPRTPGQAVDQVGIVGGEALFQWLVAPVDLETFQEAIWEQEPLLVRRTLNRGYYGGLFSKAEIDRLMREQGLQYQFNLDVVRYRNADEPGDEEDEHGGPAPAGAARQRQNFNYNGEKEPTDEGAEPEIADPEVVWRRFGEGCSLRVLHPQRWCDPLWRLLARLESYLQCCVGCNAYLTPAGTQGFAPHWDDIDAYVLQLEGKKRWRLYQPASPECVLPRHASRDFAPQELGPCVLDCTVEPGDLLYLPRGLVHQAESLPDAHSLHLTVSANQQRSWAAFLERALPRALREAVRTHVALRQTLPRDFLEYMGVQHDTDAEPGAEPDQQRVAFQEQAALLVDAVVARLPLDAVADQFGADFLADRLPPVLPPQPGAPAGGAEAGSSRQLSEGTTVRLAMPGIARIVIAEGEEESPDPVVQLHHCMANRRQAHASKRGAAAEAGDGQGQPAVVPDQEEAGPPGVIEFPMGCAEVLDILVNSGGVGVAVRVADLPPPEDCDLSALEVAQALADAGLCVAVGG